MTRVVFALERSAQEDQPGDEGFYPTEYGVAECVFLWEGHWRTTNRAWFHPSGERMDPQPSVWYDLRPTDGEGITVDDLEETVTALMALAVTLPSGYHRARTQQIFARLRAALDALT